MLAGVAEGLSRYFGIDANIIRIGFAVLAILGLVGSSFGFGGIPFYLAGIPLYLALWVLIPEEGHDQLDRGAVPVLGASAVAVVASGSAAG